MSATAMNHRADTCPDLETIAAFLDARLDERERETVAGHVAACDKCYFIFTEASEARRVAAAQPSEPVPVVWWKRRQTMWSAAAGLAAAAALVIAVRVGPSLGPSEPSLDALVAAVGTERLVEPRLTGGFAYGPVRGPVRSGQAQARFVSPDVRLAAARIEKDTTSQYSATAFHARGLAALVTGDVDRAVTTLEAAASQQPNDARILSDLGAAYLVRSAHTNTKDDLSKALATLNRATEIDRQLVEAQFNRAFTLERLGLTVEAREAWRSYLAIDDRTPWAVEARDRYQQLSPQP